MSTSTKIGIAATAVALTAGAKSAQWQHHKNQSKRHDEMLRHKYFNRYGGTLQNKEHSELDELHRTIAQ